MSYIASKPQVDAHSDPTGNQWRDLVALRDAKRVPEGESIAANIQQIGHVERQADRAARQARADRCSDISALRDFERFANPQLGRTDIPRDAIKRQVGAPVDPRPVACP